MPRGRPFGTKEAIPRKWKKLSQDYIDELNRLGYSLSWIKKMRSVVKEVPTIVDVKDPSAMTRDQYIAYLDNLVGRHDNTDYRRQKLSCLNKLLARYGNYVFSTIPYKWAPHIPVNVHWLSDIEIGHILSTPMDPVERIIIWMECRLGARRIEVIRQKADEIFLSNSRIYIRGKGGHGGKGRRLFLTPFGHEEINNFSEYRNKAIERAMEIDPETIIPDEYVIYWTTGKKQRLTTLKPTMADKFISRVSERSGITFTHHTLRRSYARKLLDMGVSLVNISKVLGHSSTKVTERYLGLDDDDIADAMMKGEDLEIKKKEVMGWDKNRKTSN